MRPRATTLLLLALVSTAAGAQNLVLNGNFDTNVSSWTPYDPEVILQWDALDANGSPGSGSVLARNTAAAGLNSGFFQCVNVVAGQHYDFGGKVRIPSGGVQGQTYLGLSWMNGAGCTGSFIGSTLLLYPSGFDAWQALALTDQVAPPGAVSAQVHPSLVKQGSGGEYRSYFDELFLAPTGSCVANGTTACVDDQTGDQRFRIRVDYQTTQAGGRAGPGHALSLASLGVFRGGLFWFFSADNPEMLIKVLNGCGVNDRYWVYYSAGTNVGLTTTVTDTQTGAVWTRQNPDLTAAPPVQDTQAFPCN